MRNKIVLPKWTGSILILWMYGAIIVTCIAAALATEAVVHCFLPDCRTSVIEAVAYFGVGSILVPAFLSLLRVIVDLLGQIFELEYDPDDWDDC